MTTSAWPPPFPFPPSADEEWTREDVEYLKSCIQWRLQNIDGAQMLDDESTDELVKKLASSKAVRRFERVKQYELKNSDDEITYIQWLDRVLTGYQAYRTLLDEYYATTEGEISLFHKQLHTIANQVYFKHFKSYPQREQIDDLASELAVAVVENYFFDIELDFWLRRTAKNIIISRSRHFESSLDDDDFNWETSLQLSSSTNASWLSSRIHHDAILEAIQKIPNQRYRIVLLLIYIYDLNSTEMAALFGVTVSQIHTWRSRSRKALREVYKAPHE